MKSHGSVKYGGFTVFRVIKTPIIVVPKSHSEWIGNLFSRKEVFSDENFPMQNEKTRRIRDKEDRWYRPIKGKLKIFIYMQRDFWNSGGGGERRRRYVLISFSESVDTKQNVEDEKWNGRSNEELGLERVGRWVGRAPGRCSLFFFLTFLSLFHGWKVWISYKRKEKVEDEIIGEVTIRNRPLKFLLFRHACNSCVFSAREIFFFLFGILSWWNEHK